MTSNAGAREASKKSMGFGQPSSDHKIGAAVERTFSPEFRNRLDAVVQFGSLPASVVRMVVDKFLGQLNTLTADKDVTITATDEVKDWLAELGYKPEFGAREMNRVIHREVKLQLAEQMLFGALEHGGEAKLSLETDKDGQKSIKITCKKAKKTKAKTTKKKSSKSKDNDSSGKDS